jgi:hypothetical protein
MSFFAKFVPRLRALLIPGRGRSSTECQVTPRTVQPNEMHPGCDDRFQL